MAFQDVQSRPGNPEDRPGGGHGWRARKHRRQGQGQGCGRQGRGAAAMPDEADLRLIIMALLAEQPRTGFETMQALAERVGCAHASSAVVVYPNLMMLEETGLIAASTDLAGRKVYALVNEGLAALAKTGLLVDAILADAAGIDIDLGGAGPGMGRAATPGAGRRRRWCRRGGGAAQAAQSA